MKSGKSKKKYIETPTIVCSGGARANICNRAVFGAGSSFTMESLIVSGSPGLFSESDHVRLSKLRANIDEYTRLVDNLCEDQTIKMKLSIILGILKETRISAGDEKYLRDNIKILKTNLYKAQVDAVFPKDGESSSERQSFLSAISDFEKNKIKTPDQLEDFMEKMNLLNEIAAPTLRYQL